MTHAEAARDAGMAAVEQSNADWMFDALIALASLPSGTEGIGEDFRHSVTKLIGEPTKPHAWGALIRTAIRHGVLEATGEMRAMRDTRSHARKSFVYRTVG
jgi:hypothetical protein